MMDSPIGPAEELRTAATLIRETAQGTTPTPWRVRLRYSRKSPDLLAGADFQTPLHTSGISLKYPHLLADTQWKVLTSPAIAEPLARLLEEAAELYEWPLKHCHADLRDQLEPRVRAQVEHELALARSILGRAS